MITKNRIFKTSLIAVLILVSLNLTGFGSAEVAHGASTSNLATAVVHGTWTFNFETGLEGSAAGTDFWWRQVTDTVRYLVPQHGARVTNLGKTIAYSDIDYGYATELFYSSNSIDGSISSNQIPAGTVLVWISAEGNYVKMRIDTYGYDLHFTYEILAPARVRGTWTFDFETGLEGSAPGTDFWWRQVTETERYLVPQHGAQVVNLGATIAYSTIDYTYASGLTYSANSIDGSIGNNHIPAGTVLVWISAEGNYVKMRIEQYGYNLYFIYEILVSPKITLKPVFTVTAIHVPTTTITPTQPTSLSAWATTTPTIDGEISSGEWQDADSVIGSIGCVQGQATTHEVMIYVKNDATNLYLAVVVKGDEFNSNDFGNWWFKDDPDGPIQVGDDGLSIRSDGLASDTYRSNDIEGWWSRDESSGGSNDLVGDASHTNPSGIGDYTFEYQHPLDTTDDMYDFSLQLGDAIGFQFSFADGGPEICGEWPGLSEGYGTIVIAKPTGLSEALSAWATTIPRIDGMISNGEWQDADSVVSFIECTEGQATTHEVIIYVKNDATNLYLAVVVKGDEFNSNDFGNWWFKDDPDGPIQVGDDGLSIRSDGLSNDRFRSKNIEGWWSRDADDGGTNDLVGAASHTNPGGVGDYVFEYQHPLDTNDNVHDFSLQLGDAIGFQFSFADGGPEICGEWPGLSEGYGTIIIARPPIRPIFTSITTLKPITTLQPIITPIFTPIKTPTRTIITPITTTPKFTPILPVVTLLPTLPIRPIASAVVHGTWEFDFETGREGTAAGTDFWWEQVTETERYLVPQHGAQVVNLGTRVAYSDIDYAYASGLTYSANNIDGSVASNQIPSGTVLVWTSSDGNYVKMRVDKYGYDLYFTYEILTPTVVHGTWEFDFETGLEGTAAGTDFWWEQVTETERYLVPQHGAQVVNLGTRVAYEDVDYAYATSLTYSTDNVDGSIRSNQIPAGTVLVWISSEGNYVKMRVDEYGYDLYFTYEILAASVVHGTWTFDFETGFEGLVSGTDFWWEQVTETERYLVPQNGAQVVNLGTNVAYEDVDYDYASGLTYSTDRVDGSTGNNQIPSGTVLVWISSEGNYVKMRIDEYGYDMYFTYEILGKAKIIAVLTPGIIDLRPITTEPRTTTAELETTTAELETTTAESETLPPESTSGGIPTPGFELVSTLLAIPFLLWFRRRRR